MSTQRAIAILSRVKRCANMDQVRRVFDALEPEEKKRLAAPTDAPKGDGGEGKKDG